MFKAVGPLLVTALLCTAAPAIAANLPEPPSEPPDPAQRGTALLRASGNERMIILRLACHDAGKVTVATVAPKRRLGTTRFACNRGRAVARMRVSRRAARSARARGSIEAVATVVSADEHSRFELKMPQGRDGDARLADISRWYVPPAWCTGIGFTMSIDNTVRFHAEWGETVWWRPMAEEFDIRTGVSRGWKYSPYWQSHRAVPGDGMFLILGNGRIEFTWTVVQSAAYVASRYGVTVDPAYQVYTDRGGYRAYYVGVTTGDGYGEQAVDRCAVPFP